MRFRIYYGDGSTRSNEDGPIADVPGTNVQAIVQADEDVGRYVLHHCDFYWWENDQWYQSDHFGLWDYLVRPGMKKVLFGRSLANVEYKAILATAINDPDFAPKSASLPGEGV